MIAADNKVRCAIVFADDSMPKGLSRACHAHCKRKKSKVRHAIGIFSHDRLVDTDTSVVVDVTGFGEANDGMDEDICLVLACGTDSQFTMRTVHGIARLECSNFPPCELFEVCAEFRRSVCRPCECTNQELAKPQLTSKWNVVKICRLLDGRNLAPNVELFYSCAQICDRWMGGVIRTEDFDSLFHTIGLVNIINCERLRLCVQVRCG